MTSSRGRTCYSCRHLRVDTEIPAYSEVTPGEPFAMKCEKGHWSVRPWTEVEPGEMEANLMRFAACPDKAWAAWTSEGEG